MLDPESTTRTTRAMGRCPHCAIEAVDLAGRVTFSDLIIQLDYRCEACGASFLFVRKPRPIA
jgi:DNA-directed RNA polymerase subunit RPC12/RpoP